MPTPTEFLNIWYSALPEPVGIYLILMPGVSPLDLKPGLYLARRERGDPALSHLQIRTAPPRLPDQSSVPGLGVGQAIWIVHGPRDASALPPSDSEE